MLDRIEGLYQRAYRMLDAAEASGKHGPALGALRELRSTLELLGRVTGELVPRPHIEVTARMVHERRVTLTREALQAHIKNLEAELQRRQSL